MIPFTYLLTHRPTGRRYYGVRYAKGCHPDQLWSLYYSSSKIVKLLIEKYGVDSFDYEIRKTFNTREAALDWEHRVLQRLKPYHKKEWINLHNGTSCYPEAQLRGARSKKPWREDDPRRTARQNDERWKQIGRENLKRAITPEARLKSKETTKHKMTTDPEFAKKRQMQTKSMQSEEVRQKAIQTKRLNEQHGKYDQQRKDSSIRIKQLHAQGHYDNICTLERNQKISIAKKLNNPLTVRTKCIHCGAEGNVGSIKRWHDDNCRSFRL